MPQQPNVRMTMHPSFFDLMMSILDNNAKNSPVEQTRNDAADLFDKRMRFSRRCQGVDGKEYVSVRMYESEAAETIWQLLTTCAAHYDATHEFSRELKELTTGMIPV